MYGGCGPHVVTVMDNVDEKGLAPGATRSAECLNLGKKFPLKAFKAIYVDGQIWLEPGSCVKAAVVLPSVASASTSSKNVVVRKANQPSVLDFFTRKGERKDRDKEKDKFGVASQNKVGSGVKAKGVIKK